MDMVLISNIFLSFIWVCRKTAFTWETFLGERLWRAEEGGTPALDSSIDDGGEVLAARTQDVGPQTNSLVQLFA